jgi:hypothetical protein
VKRRFGAERQASCSARSSAPASFSKSRAKATRLEVNFWGIGFDPAAQAAQN